MAKKVKINGVTYDDAAQVNIPLADDDGVAVYYDTTPSTAEPSQVLQGKTAFLDNGQVVGTMRNNQDAGGTISTPAGTYTIPEGYHNGKGTVKLADEDAAAITSANVKAGVTILGVPGKATVVDTDDADATPATIAKGKTAYVNGAKITGKLTSPVVSQDPATKVLTIE